MFFGLIKSREEIAKELKNDPIAMRKAMIKLNQTINEEIEACGIIIPRVQINSEYKINKKDEELAITV